MWHASTIFVKMQPVYETEFETSDIEHLVYQTENDCKSEKGNHFRHGITDIEGQQELTVFS